MLQIPFNQTSLPYNTLLNTSPSDSKDIPISSSFISLALTPTSILLHTFASQVSEYFQSFNFSYIFEVIASTKSFAIILCIQVVGCNPSSQIHSVLLQTEILSLNPYFVGWSRT